MTATHGLQALQVDAERRSAFLSRVRHDLKTPVVNASSLLSLLFESVALTPEQQEYRQLIDVATLRWTANTNLIVDYLDLCTMRMMSPPRALQLTETSFDLRALVDTLVEPFRASGQRRGIQVDVRLLASTTTPEEPVTITADQQRMRDLLCTLTLELLAALPKNSNLNISCMLSETARPPAQRHRLAIMWSTTTPDIVMPELRVTLDSNNYALATCAAYIESMQGSLTKQTLVVSLNDLQLPALPR
jgi:hypothetical protein